MDSAISTLPDPPEGLPDAHEKRRCPRASLWRRLAAVAGLVAGLCALAFPFLPVVQETARISWPVNGDTTAVNAPLAAYSPQWARATLPCATVRALDARTDGSASLLSTVPPARADSGAGMRLTVRDGTLTVFDRGERVAEHVLRGAACDVTVHTDPDATTVAVGGTPAYHVDGDVRPRVIGIYSDVDGDLDPVAGLAVSITPDTRYQSSATALKIAVVILGAGALVGCLAAVWRIDTVLGRRAPRRPARRWWRPTGRDVAVVGVLGLWVFIGPVTSDDGYILTMARVAEDAGYLTNYHRWFGVAEAPFGWFYHVYQIMSQVSVSPPWIRLPSFALGVGSWLLLSRAVLPRLGAPLRASRAAGWAAATVFCVWWLPYDNGVRPEPVAALGSLLALCAVERALATRRMLPVCLGVLVAGFTFAATPTGLLAVAPFLVSARPLFHLVRDRARHGRVAALAPVAASASAVLFVVFADQTFATVAEATRLRDEVGPSMAWFEELARYDLLLSQSADGAATRRFPVLLLVLCTGTCLAVLLRRGRVPGAALGPSRRLIGTVALFFVLLALTPTKWTHHFGAFAAVGAAMAALTALATSASVLRSRRNRAVFVAGLLLVGALSATAPNAYWFVSQIGVPWSDLPPQLAGITVATLLTGAAAVAALVSFAENVRVRRPGPPSTPERPRAALSRGSVAIVVVCGLVVTAEIASMVKAMIAQSGTYSLGAANIDHVFGGNCGLGDRVLVEPDPRGGVLAPVSGTAPGDDPRRSGFHTRPAGADDPLADTFHGLDADHVPMWSSHGETDTPAGLNRSPWYRLGDVGADDQLVVTAVAPAGAQVRVELQLGRDTPEGTTVLGTHTVLAPGDGTGEWEDIRFRLADLGDGVTAARVIAVDDDLTEDGWVAATAPRVPAFATLTEVVGTAPVYVDWPASFVYPCLEPMKVRDGVLEVPAYHLTATPLADEAGWASADAGGVLGNLDELGADRRLPSHLDGDPDQPWGELHAVVPYTRGAPATVDRTTRVRPGWWSPGPGPNP